jgi:hypothetical protein
LVHEVRLEALDVDGPAQEEEVAVEAQVELLSNLFLEALQPPDRLEPDANVQLVREQRADTPGAVARRPATERVTLDKDRPSAPELREVTQRGRTHDAAADDDDVCALGHPLMINDARGRARLDESLATHDTDVVSCAHVAHCDGAGVLERHAF